MLSRGIDLRVVQLSHIIAGKKMSIVHIKIYLFQKQENNQTFILNLVKI